MIIGTAAQRPPVLALGLRDRQIIDARDPHSHQAVLVEFPIFIAEAAKPMTAVVMPLIGESHGDSIFRECPQLLDQTVVKLTRPFAREKRLDGVASLEELDAVPPAAVRRIGKRDAR